MDPIMVDMMRFEREKALVALEAEAYWQEHPEERPARGLNNRKPTFDEAVMLGYLVRIGEERLKVCQTTVDLSEDTFSVRVQFPGRVYAGPITQVIEEIHTWLTRPQ